MLDYRGYIFDLDGTIYLGENAIEGAPEVIAKLQELNKKYLFLTNKTIESRDRYVEKLNQLGMAASLDNIISPTIVLIRYLKDKHPNAKVYVIGEDIIKEECQAAGLSFASTPEETDIVVISWDREFHYKHLNFAYQAIKTGALAIATNPDRTCPMEDGDVPDCGAMIGAIEGATGKKIDLIIGKPSPIMVKAAMEILNIEPQDCLMVGDRLETDIKMGVEAGMHTALVLTGVTQREMTKHSTVKPDYILSSVHEIVKTVE